MRLRAASMPPSRKTAASIASNRFASSESFLRPPDFSSPTPRKSTSPIPYDRAFAARLVALTRNAFIFESAPSSSSGKRRKSMSPITKPRTKRLMHREVSEALEGCDECERSLDVGRQWWDERDDGGRGARRHSLVRVQVGESMPAGWRGGAGRVVAEAGAQSHSDIRDTG